MPVLGSGLFPARSDFEMSRLSAPEKRKTSRVEFSHGVDVQIVAIDGTWTRPCKMTDASPTGAKLLIEGPVQGLAIREFFLLLSSTGTAFRRCELAWFNDGHMGVRFLTNKDRRPET